MAALRAAGPWLDGGLWALGDVHTSVALRGIWEVTSVQWEPFQRGLQCSARKHESPHSLLSFGYRIWVDLIY